MKLYYSPGSCSLGPNIIVNELGFECQFEEVNIREGTYAGGDYKKINPQGAVPVLEMKSGSLLLEAAVIIQYLCDLKPERGLLPKVGDEARYKHLEWLNFIGTELHKGFGPLWKPNTPDEYKTIVKDNLNDKLQYLVSVMQNKPYLMGNEFSAPDAYLYNILSWARPLKIDLSLFPTLVAYMERMKDRPAVRQAIETQRPKRQ